MNEDWKKMLTKDCATISDTLRFDEDTMLQLKAKGFLTEEQLDLIRSKPTRLGKCSTFLDMLEKRPDVDMYNFIDVLVVTKQDQLACNILGRMKEVQVERAAKDKAAAKEIEEIEIRLAKLKEKEEQKCPPSKIEG